MQLTQTSINSVVDVVVISEYILLSGCRISWVSGGHLNFYITRLRFMLVVCPLKFYKTVVAFNINYKKFNRNIGESLQSRSRDFHNTSVPAVLPSGQCTEHCTAKMLTSLMSSSQDEAGLSLPKACGLVIALV